MGGARGCAPVTSMSEGATSPSGGFFDELKMLVDYSCPLCLLHICPVFFCLNKKHVTHTPGKNKVVIIGKK
jgi:hypothetical protein